MELRRRWCTPPDCPPVIRPKIVIVALVRIIGRACVRLEFGVGRPQPMIVLRRHLSLERKLLRLLSVMNSLRRHEHLIAIIIINLIIIIGVVSRIAAVLPRIVHIEAVVLDGAP